MIWLADACPRNIIMPVPTFTPALDALRLSADNKTIDRRRSSVAFKMMNLGGLKKNSASSVLGNKLEMLENKKSFYRHIIYGVTGSRSRRISYNGSVHVQWKEVLPKLYHPYPRN